MTRLRFGSLTMRPSYRTAYARAHASRPHSPSRPGWVLDARKGRSPMTEFVRVKGPDGSEFTSTKEAAAVFGATVIDKEAVDVNGRPLPAKNNIHKGGSVKAAD